MKYLEIKKIYEKSDQFLNNKITIAGWLRTCRVSKNCSFLEINDGSHFKSLQVVVNNDYIEYDKIIKTNIGSSLEISGQLLPSPASGQEFELLANDIKLLGESEGDYPLQKKGHSFEFLREIAHLRPRANTFSAVFRLRSFLSQAIHRFFAERDFHYVHTPILSSSDCEGAGDMFQVTTFDLAKVPLNEKNEVDFKKDFFGKKAGLTVSGQLQSEALISGLNRVYTFGPTFRAENSYTTRHASEFWMIEPEMAFYDLADNMNLAEEMLKFLISEILEKMPNEMDFFNQFMDKSLISRLQAIVKSDFDRVSYTEAIDLLLKAKKEWQYPVSWGIDLQTEHERYLAEEVFRKPIFVINYPKDIKAFYMRQNEDGKTVAAMDLLVPKIGEIIGGSQREERYGVLKSRLEAMDLDAKEYKWYLDLRKYGSIVHSGYGLGFERLLMYLSGIGNIRDVIPFPRTPKNLEF